MENRNIEDVEAIIIELPDNIKIVNPIEEKLIDDKNKSKQRAKKYYMNNIEKNRKKKYISMLNKVNGIKKPKEETLTKYNIRFNQETGKWQ